MAKSNLERLRAAYIMVAHLILHDPVYLPIFLRLEPEIAAAEIEGDVIYRARAIAARQKAIA